MNIRKLLDWRKLLIYSHRWLGIVITVMFLIWTLSGVVLMYYGHPQITTGDRLLQPTTVTSLQAPQRLTSGQTTGHGLGWDLQATTLAGQAAHAVGYTGESFGGRMISLMSFPERGIVVAVMSNVSYADTPALAVKVAEPFAEHAR